MDDGFDFSRIVIPFQWKKIDITTYNIFQEWLSTECLNSEDSMTIKKSIAQYSSNDRTAIGDRICLWEWHSNTMVLTSLKVCIRFNGIQSQKRSLFPVNIAPCLVSYNHIPHPQIHEVCNHLSPKKADQCGMSAVRNRNNIRAHHIS